ncbi:helix-turn-helix domain-containing protein [Desulfogranum mediterraneum]|uniref:hypothetical protein n=1 Tax=Desulfogranum mediterraneum TaxID=160661 RepID=UPI000413258C|nr:hypothetical protein [Desulfogranum mediterraneum]
MTTRQEKKAAYIRDVVAKSMIPRNQIANISGLTNTYIRDLEQGNIANVSRDKLLKFATAVGLDLEAIDELLTIFDRSKLNPDDIPAFIENAKKQKPSNSVHAARDFFGYELLLLATESLPGPKTINTNHPTVILQPEELRFAFLERSAHRLHPIHNELRRAIARERKQNLIRQLGKYVMHHYISKRALDDYVLSCTDQRERQLKIRHLLNIREFIESYPRFRCYLTELETGFNCLLKHARTEGEAERVFFYTHDMSLLQGRLNGQIIGFYTAGKVIIDQFKKDVGIVESGVLEAYREPADLALYLTRLIERASLQ